MTDVFFPVSQLEGFELLRLLSPSICASQGAGTELGESKVLRKEIYTLASGLTRFEGCDLMNSGTKINLMQFG